MKSYRATAFYLALWYAALTGVTSLLLIVLKAPNVATAFLIAANAALLFALLLVAAVNHFTDRRITRAQFWHALPPDERGAGEAGRRMARQALHDVWLGFAKGAAAAAIVLGTFALLSNGVGTNAVRGTSLAQSQPDQSAMLSYRAARVDPTN